MGFPDDGIRMKDKTLLAIFVYAFRFTSVVDFLPMPWVLNP